MKKRMLITLLFPLLLLGCSSTPTPSFYVLSGLDNNALHDTRINTKRSSLRLAVGPVTIPQYLNRPQHVIFRDHHQVTLLEYHRWAQPLTDSIPKLLATNLSKLLHTNHILMFPWRGGVKYDVQVEVHILDFYADEHVAVLKARWHIKTEQGERIRYSKTSRYELGNQMADDAGRVAAMSHALEALSREIAKVVARY